MKVASEEKGRADAASEYVKEELRQANEAAKDERTERTMWENRFTALNREFVKLEA